MISGTEYHRSKARMSIRRLAERAGVSVAVLQKLCGGEPPLSTPLEKYMRVAEALGVSIADLLRMHDERELDIGDQAAYPSRTEQMTNCVAVYRRAKGLTYEQLALRLGSPNRECGRRACMTAHAGKKHVRVLAAYEGITPEQFRKMYAPDKGVA